MKQWHEPSDFVQGDTLSFCKRLPKYPATAGWSLLYALRGNGQAIEFVSVADNDNHQITVDAATTESWLPAAYKLEGFAVNVGGERHQIYTGSFQIAPDLSSASPDLDTRTHAQRMLANIEQQLEALSKNVLLQTTVEGTEILRERRMELVKQRQSYLQERRGEIAKENVKNGRPSGRKIKCVINMTPPAGVPIRALGAGSSIYNLDWR